MSEIAILLAAGQGLRLKPITETIPKPLVKVNGKVMIESVIDGLIKRDIKKIIVVTGYLSGQFDYLINKYPGLVIIFNKDYQTVNNIGSLYLLCDELLKTDSDVFICDSDLYVIDNSVFIVELNHSCYFGKMVPGHSDDWVFDVNKNGRITRVGRVGYNQFNMVGVAWFRKNDARLLGRLIWDAYGKDGYENLFWDDVVNSNLDKLDLIVHEINGTEINEIDTVDELAGVDESYLDICKGKR